MPDKTILNPKEAIEYLCIGISQCYELLFSNLFPVLNLCRLERVSQSVSDECITKHTQEKGALS